MLRAFVVIAGIAILAGGFWLGASVWSGTKDVRIPAIGGTWTAQNLQWHQEGEMWRVSAIMAPYRVRLASTTGDELLTSFCGALLTVLPGPEEMQVTRERVYRVDLNVIAADEETRIFPSMVSIAIDAGRCRIDEWGGTTYFPVLTGEAADWYVQSSGMMKGGGTLVPAIVLRPRPDRMANPNTFPFAEACGQIVRDPLIFSENTLPNGEVLFVPPKPGETLAITAQGAQRGRDGVFVGIFANEVFTVIENGCEARAI